MKSFFNGNKATGICTITQSSFTFKITIILVADTVLRFLAKVEKIELCGDRYIFYRKTNSSLISFILIGPTSPKIMIQQN